MDMDDSEFGFSALDFGDLENRLGHENAMIILRLLEQFEGVSEARVRRLPAQERMDNVFRLMKENMRHQTRH